MLLKFFYILLLVLLMHVSSFASDLDVIQNRTPVELRLWEAWKLRYAVPLTHGTLILDPSTKKVFSEGSAHALLLAVQFKDSLFYNQVLSGLYSYFRNQNGLFAWQINLDGSQKSDAQMSASETEIVVLFSLLQAQKLVEKHLWEPTLNYRLNADQLNRDIWTHEIYKNEHTMLLLPSDQTGNPHWPILKTTNPERIVWTPTYHIPAFLRAFEVQYPNDPWQSLRITGNNLIFSILQIPQKWIENRYGLHSLVPIPTWVYLEKTGSDMSIKNYYLHSPEDSYSNDYDGIRAPMYWGLDYIWNKDQEAQKLVSMFLKQSGVCSMEQARLGSEPDHPGGYHNEIAIGLYGVAHYVIGSNITFKSALESQIDIGTYTFGKFPQYYYNQTFCLYSYLIMNGRFVKILGT